MYVCALKLKPIEYYYSLFAGILYQKKVLILNKVLVTNLSVPKSSLPPKKYQQC